jgi:hypothetical protein
MAFQARSRRLVGLGAPTSVNNAAFARSTRLPELTIDEWRRAIDVNMTAPFVLTKAVVPAMTAAGYGRIINISSSAGRTVSTLGGAHYTASKAGMLGLTRAAAKELGKFGITVNAVCPGMIDTELTHENATPELLERLAASYPIPRLGTAVEVADLVCFGVRAGWVHDRYVAGHHRRRPDDVASSSHFPHERKHARFWSLWGGGRRRCADRCVGERRAAPRRRFDRADRSVVGERHPHDGDPAVVSLIILGVASASDVRAIGRLGGRTLVVFLLLIMGLAIVMMPLARSRSRCFRRRPVGVRALPAGAARGGAGSGGRSESRPSRPG